MGTAVEAGAAVLKPAEKSFRGYGCSLRDPAGRSGRSPRIVIGGEAGTFTDPDGFEWEAAAA